MKTEIFSRQEVDSLLADGGQLVEVLSSRQYQDVHLAGAISLPLETLDSDVVRRLDNARPVIVYCNDFQ